MFSAVVHMFLASRGKQFTAAYTSCFVLHVIQGFRRHRNMNMASASANCNHDGLPLQSGKGTFLSTLSIYSFRLLSIYLHYPDPDSANPLSSQHIFPCIVLNFFASIHSCLHSLTFSNNDWPYFPDFRSACALFFLLG